MIMDLKIQDMEMMMESDGNKQRTAIATTTAAASCSIDDSNDKNHVLLATMTIVNQQKHDKFLANLMTASFG